MFQFKFQFDNEYVVCKPGDTASSDIIYYTNSKGTPCEPQPTPGTALGTSYYKRLVYTTSEVVKGSLSISEQRMKDLMSSSNIASFTLKREPLFDAEGNRTLTGVIANGRSTGRVTIYENNSAIYTGCISSTHNWVLGSAGLTDLTIQCHDVTSVYMKIPFTKSGVPYTSFKGTLGGLIQQIADLSGLELATDVSSLTQPIIAKVPNGTTCEEVLCQAVYEHGYIYYSNAEGQLCIEAIDLDTTTADYTIWAADTDEAYEEGDPLLRVKQGVAVTQSHDLGDYSSVEVQYAQLERVEDLKVVQIDNGKGENTTLSAHNWYDGYTSRDKEAGTLPTITNPGYQRTGSLGTTTRWGLSVPTGSTWDSIAIRVTWSKDGLLGQGYYGIRSYIAKKVTTTETKTEYDEDGEPYEVAVTNENYIKISNEVTGGDEGDTEFIFKLTESCMTPDLYLIVRKTYDLLGKGKLGVTVNSDAVRWISTMGTTAGPAGQVEFVDVVSGLPLWYVGDVRIESNNSAATRITTVDLYDENRDASTWSKILIDNTQGNSPISFKMDIVADEAWRSLSTDEYAAYTTAEVTNYVDTVDRSRETFRCQAQYTHEESTCSELAERLAKYYGYCATTYTFRSDNNIPIGSVVRIKDNMYSHLNVLLFVFSREKKYTAGSCYVYKGFALSEIGYVATRNPIGTIKSGTPQYNPRWNFAGDWNSSTHYRSNNEVIDVVFYNGSSWMCKSDNTNKTPSESSSYWSLFAKAGEDADSTPFIKLIPAPASFVKNARGTSANNTISVHLTYQGIDETSISCSWQGITGSTVGPSVTITDGSFTIPYATSYTAVRISVTADISASAGSRISDTVDIPAVDTTEYDMYLGAASVAPTVSVADGDSYFNTSDKKIYYRLNGTWVELGNSGVPSSKKSEICGKAQKDALASIPAGSVTSSDYAYFNDLIAGTVTANYIKSQTGVFDSITVTNSTITTANITDANVSGDFVGNKVYIKALRGVSLTPQTRYFESELVRGNVPCVTMAEWRAAFPFDGCYLITSGKINGQTITQGNITFGQWEGHSEGTIFGTIGTYMYQAGNFFCSNESNTLVYMPSGAFENLAGPSTVTVPSVMPSIDVRDGVDSSIKTGGYIGSSQRPWAQIWGRSVHGAVFN